MNNQTIKLEAYELIRLKVLDLEEVSDGILGAYVKGIVNLQTELCRLNEKAGETIRNDLQMTY